MSTWKIGKSLMKQYYLKKKNYSNISMEDITDVDYMHGKRVCKEFEIENLGEYHDFLLKRDTLL